MESAPERFLDTRQDLRPLPSSTLFRETKNGFSISLLHLRGFAVNLFSLRVRRGCRFIRGRLASIAEER